MLFPGAVSLTIYYVNPAILDELAGVCRLGAGCCVTDSMVSMSFLGAGKGTGCWGPATEQSMVVFVISMLFLGKSNRSSILCETIYIVKPRVNKNDCKKTNLNFSCIISTAIVFVFRSDGSEDVR
jgi:hypothetical protein